MSMLLAAMSGAKKIGWSGMKSGARGLIGRFGSGASAITANSSVEIARATASVWSLHNSTASQYIPSALSRSPKLFGLAAMGTGTLFANSGNEERPSLMRYMGAGAAVLGGGMLASRGIGSLVSGPMTRKYVQASARAMGTGKVLPNMARNAGIMKSFGSNEARQYLFASGALVSGLAFNSMFSTGKTQNHAYNRGSGNKIR